MITATFAFIVILTGVSLIFIAGYMIGTTRKEELPEKKIQRLQKEIAKLEKSLPLGLREIMARDWVLDRDQQPTLTTKPIYSRPSDLSEPQMGEGPHG